MTLSKEKAEFLIDQFNKYASWAGQINQMLLTYFAAAIAIAALLVSTAQLDPQYRLRDHLAATVLVVVAFGIAMASFCASFYRYLKNQNRLRLLMNHWHKHQALPDNLTFNKIIDSKPKELEALLAEAPRHEENSTP